MSVPARSARVLLPLVLVALAVPGARVQTQGGVNKSIFISVLDESGKPVKDIVADDILIREDNVDRQVIAVKPALQPLSVAVLVDTAQGSRVADAYGTPEEYVRDLRVAIGSFAKKILGQSPNVSISLMEFGQAALTMVKYTTDPIEFEKGVNHIVARPGVASVLGEALEAANKDLAERPGWRKAIVSINLEPSNEQSFENGKPIGEAFRKSGAQLWAVSVQRGKLQNSKRDLVLNDFAKLSGGQRDFIMGISAVEGILAGYADALTYQYEVVYSRPESNKATKIVQLGTPRQGVKLHASGFPPK
jgi:hypothetical protein